MFPIYSRSQLQAYHTKKLEEHGRLKDSYTPNEAAKLLREVFGVPRRCHEELKTFGRLLAERGITEANIKILLTGRTGRGFSVTNDVNTHSYQEDGIQITLVDSPGLQHGQSSDSFFGTLVKDLMIKGDDTSIVLYCRKMTEQRFEDDEVKAIRQLYQAFGPQFWERVVIVLTFANMEEESCAKARPGDPPFNDRAAWDKLVIERFCELVERRSDELRDALRENIPMPAVVDHIRFVPAGHYVASRYHPEPLSLPDRKNWLYNLLELCCNDDRSLSLSKLSLRDNLHLAIILDNEGEINADENSKTDFQEEIVLNQQALMYKNHFEEEGFMVLAFNALSPQSISQLVETLTTSVQSVDLAAFALVILCKGKTCNEINMKVILSPFNRSFSKLSKIFITHFADFKSLPKLPDDDLPPNSIFVNISSLNTKCSKEIVSIFKKNFKEVFATAVKECFKRMSSEIAMLESCRSEFEETFGPNNRQVLPGIFEPQIPKANLDFRKKKLDIQRAIWHKVCSETFEALCDNKDEIRTLLRNERIARIGSSVAGILIGGGLVVAGIAAAPFTFGASVGLSVAGGAVGAAAGMGNIAALATRKVMANSRLKKAQEQVTFDQQCSRNINKAVAEYYEAIQDHLQSLPNWDESIKSPSSSEFGVKMGHTFVTAGGGIGMAAAIGAEGVVESTAVALRTTGRIAGMALPGVSLAVTVPIDIAFIAYHSYRIHQARGDNSGVNEKDEFVKWFIQQIESLLLDTVSISKHQQTTETEAFLPEFGFQIKAPIPDQTFMVRTMFSGPFILPPATTLVSAIYDVFISQKLERPAFIDIEHCVDVAADRSITKLMSFAVGKLDIAKKAYEFTLLASGGINDTNGTIPVTENCLLCILYTGPPEKNPLKYAALCAYCEEYRNSWSLKIAFTKYLSAHLKVYEREFPVYEEAVKAHKFKLENPVTGIHLERLNFDDVQSQNPGWVLAIVPPALGKKKVSKITKKQLDTMEMQHDLSNSPVLKIPSIELRVQVTDEMTAFDQLNYTIHVQGTDLRIRVHRRKRKKTDSIV